MAKKAFLCGINYPGTSHALRGCVNDVRTIQGILEGSYGFAHDDIHVLTDHNATTNNMKKELAWLVQDAKVGDILFFHYSGHGSQVVDSKYDNDEEPDGMDEILCPMDLNWRDKIIRDDDLKAVFDKVPAGVNLTVLLDCCNSGSGLDQANQYQPLGEARNALRVLDGSEDESKSRFLPPPEDIVVLREERNLHRYKPRALTRHVDQTGLLISGCQAHQTSADAYIGSRYVGACTHMVAETLKEHNYSLDYKTLVDEVNNKMVQHGFTQRPELNGSSELFTYKYLTPMGKLEVEPEQPQEDDRPPKPKRPRPACIRCKRDKRGCYRKCNGRWYNTYWRFGLWRHFYRRDLRVWKQRLRKWCRRYGPC